MSWFQTTNFTHLAKTALKEAQKTIDKALDIHDSSQQQSSNPEPPKEVENVAEENEDEDQMTRSNLTIESSIILSPSNPDEYDHGGFDEDEDCGSMMSSIQEMSSSQWIGSMSSSQYDERDHHQQQQHHLEQIDPLEQTVSFTESKWSTIEVETIEMSHSRNSSISTIPESNSHSSPERDVGHLRHNYVNGQHVLQDSPNNIPIEEQNHEEVERGEEDDFVECSHETTITNNSSVLAENVIQGVENISVQDTVDDYKIIDSSNHSNSSSSFEHISSNRLDTEGSVGVKESSNTGQSHVSANSHDGNTRDNNSNKLITKVKTNASSASSSDIEVIPMDSDPDEQTIAKILQEAETQTDESCFRTHDTCNKRSDMGVQVHIPLPPPPVQNKIEENHSTNNKFVAQMEVKLVEKDKEIEQLMEEGQKLSKKQFELSNIVKKLRAKEKETDNRIKEIKNELAEKCIEVERLMKSFVHKETVEQSQNETITKLTTEKRKLESQVERLTSELEDAKENEASMKVSLENSSLEILETKNIILATQREAAEVDRLTKEKSELLNRSETLQKQVDHLRTVVHETQQQSSEREQELKSQLATVTTQCHRLENELSDVASDVADATMPLSLEIEKLQQEIKNHNFISTKRENTLHSKITDLEQKLAQGQDRESSFTDMETTYQSNVTALESQVDRLEENCKRLQSALDEEKSTSKMKLEENCRMLEETSIEIERLRGVIESVEEELRVEQAERKKCQLLLEQQSQIIMLNSATTNSNTVVGQSQNSAMVNSTTSQKLLLNNSGQHSGNISPSSQSVLSEVSYLDEVFDPNGPNARSDLTPKSFFESFSSVNVIENLHGQLRLREGELAQYQEEVTKNEKIRKTLNEEIAQLTVQNQEFLMQMERMNELDSRLEEMNQNYNAVLQMYGEKVEEAEELRLDLQDVKDMYKAQIEQLLKR